MYIFICFYRNKIKIKLFKISSYILKENYAKEASKLLKATPLFYINIVANTLSVYSRKTEMKLNQVKITKQQ